MLAADGLFLAVAGLHGGVAAVFLAVEFNGQNRHQAAALPLVDDKIKTPGVEQVHAGRVVHKHLRNGDLPLDGAAPSIQEGVVQRVVQIFEKGLLGLGAVRLDAQRPRSGGLGRHPGCAMGLDILHEFVQIIRTALTRMQPVELRLVGQHDELLPGAGGGHVDELFVVLQPLVGFRPGSVGDGQREDHNVLFIPLEGMHRAAAGVGVPAQLQQVLNTFPLARKRRDDAHAALRVFVEIPADHIHLGRGGVLLVGGVVGDFHIDERLVAFHFAGDMQFVVVVLFVVELDNARVAAVMPAQQHLVADRVAGEEALVD